MYKNPEPQQIYKHFKGNLYRVVTLAEHTETGEELVIYQAMYGEYKVYARPLSMFMEKVDKVKYPEIIQEYRFELQNELIERNNLTENQSKLTQQKKELAEKPDETSEKQESEGEFHLDPLVLEFLDARTYEKRLNILTALHHRITDDMISTMAVVTDVEIKDGDIEERYLELRNCLLTMDKYERTRLR